MKILKLIILTALCTNLVFGDILYLRDGTKIKGTFERYNFLPGQVVFRTDQGQVLVLDILPDASDIDRITDDQGNLLFDPARRKKFRKIAIFTAFSLVLVGIIASIQIGTGVSGNSEDQDKGGSIGPIE